MPRVKVLFFASYRERTGLRELTLDLPEGARVRDLVNRLREDFPQVGELWDHALIAVDHKYAALEDVLQEGMEIAFFPPVSGGEEPPTVVMVTEEVLDLDALVARIVAPTTGAVCLFTGVVRAKTQKGPVTETSYLEYEAYVPMAEAKMRQVAREIRERWPQVEGIVIVQRIGRLVPGTPTVLIACAGPHRDSGVFEAARYGIDRLKEIVPIWKKEVGPQGEVWVEGHYRPRPGE